MAMKMNIYWLFCLSTLLCSLIACSGPNQEKDLPMDLPEEREGAQTLNSDTIPRVTGIGGIFFRSKNPAEIRDWYGENLGLAIDEYGSPFEFRNAIRPDEVNYLRWSPFEEETDYFDPSKKGIYDQLQGSKYRRNDSKSQRKWSRNRE